MISSLLNISIPENGSSSKIYFDYREKPKIIFILALFPQLNIKETFEFMSVFYKHWNNEKAYEEKTTLFHFFI